MVNATGFTIGVCFFVFCGAPTARWLLKAGRAPPQSLRFVISLVVRRVMMPTFDLLLDWATMYSYFRTGETDAAMAILTSLLVGTVAVALVSAYTASKGFTNLKTAQKESSEVAVEAGWGCLAGLAQCGPIFLGARAVRAWREGECTAARTRAASRATAQPRLSRAACAR